MQIHFDEKSPTRRCDPKTSVHSSCGLKLTHMGPAPRKFRAGHLLYKAPHFLVRARSLLLLTPGFLLLAGSGRSADVIGVEGDASVWGAGTGVGWITYTTRSACIACHRNDKSRSYNRKNTLNADTTTTPKARYAMLRVSAPRERQSKNACRLTELG
jgi:hypothetical protein